MISIVLIAKILNIGVELFLMVLVRHVNMSSSHKLKINLDHQIIKIFIIIVEVIIKSDLLIKCLYGEHSPCATCTSGNNLKRKFVLNVCRPNIYFLLKTLHNCIYSLLTQLLLITVNKIN